MVGERENYAQVTHLQTENVELKIMREEMTKYIRQLEQTNDDLERSKRATVCSIGKDKFEHANSNALLSKSCKFKRDYLDIYTQY